MMPPRSPTPQSNMPPLRHATPVTTTPKKQRTVQFSTITVFEMPVILGDNPSVSSGCPITIDWTAQRISCIPLDHFERRRPKRRSKPQLRLSSRGRQRVLLRAGFELSDLQSSRMGVMKIQKERMATIYRQRKTPGLRLGLPPSKSKSSNINNNNNNNVEEAEDIATKMPSPTSKRELVSRDLNNTTRPLPLADRSPPCSPVSTMNGPGFEYQNAHNAVDVARKTATQRSVLRRVKCVQ